MTRTIVALNAKNRIKTIMLPEETKSISLKISREKCSDVLLELIDKNNQAKGKPLNKHLPVIKQAKELKQLRFIMNDFSTKPITIELTFR